MGSMREGPRAGTGARVEDGAEGAAVTVGGDIRSWRSYIQEFL